MRLLSFYWYLAASMCDEFEHRPTSDGSSVATKNQSKLRQIFLILLPNMRCQIRAIGQVRESFVYHVIDNAISTSQLILYEGR